MDFVESLFSLIPLLLFVLFIIRIAKANSKKKRPKPLNTIPSQEESTGSEKNNRESRLESLLGEGFAQFQKRFNQASDNPPQLQEDEINVEQPDPVKQPDPRDYPSDFQDQEGLGMLKSSKVASKVAAEAPSAEAPQTNTSNAQRNRLRNLPELKQAVVWAEILGKPRGLE